MSYSRGKQQLEVLKCCDHELENESLKQELKDTRYQQKKEGLAKDWTIAELRLKIHCVEDDIFDLQVCFQEQDFLFGMSLE